MRKGQAIVEYLFVFSLMVLIAINIVKAMHEYFGDTVERLNYTLQAQLTVGTCRQECYFTGFFNGSD